MMNDLFSLKGRRAIVTGGSRGIGEMIAQGFVESGADVVITARKADALAETAERLNSIGPGRCTALACDLSDSAGIDQFVQAYGQVQGGLDILVNNAGAAWGAPFEEFPESGWDKVMTLNVKSPFFLTQALHPLLREAGAVDQLAKVINIASIDGIKPNPWETYSYQASKAAMIHLTKRLAARLIRDNIGVSAIAPGAFPSSMNKVARDHGDSIAPLIPAKRVGRTEDMAGAAVYLASRAGDYVIGDTLVVDGGVAFADLGQAWGSG